MALGSLSHFVYTPQGYHFQHHRPVLPSLYSSEFPIVRFKGFHDSDFPMSFLCHRKKPLPAPQLEKLPLPNFGTKANSVFSNPYVEAEKAKQALLEKHVKMIPTRDDIKEINGKQICWNYRKGRCRFGHNCKFAHDSDLFQGKSGGADNQLKDRAPVQAAQPDESVIEAESEISQEGQIPNRKKRPGLSQTLIPGKKVLKMYKRQRDKDSSWRN